MTRPVAAEARNDYRIWLRYADATEGEVDLSEFAGKGVFELWKNYHMFEGVHIGERGQIAWSEEIDMCPDALYLRLTGERPEDVFTGVRDTAVDA